MDDLVHSQLISIAESGAVELGWYEIGRVIAINNGTDFMYDGDLDIWPGTSILNFCITSILCEHSTYCSFDV